MNSLLNSVQRRFKSRPDELLQHLPAAALVCIISKTAYDASQIWQSTEPKVDPDDSDDDDDESTETKCFNGVMSSLKHIKKVFEIVEKNCEMPQDAIVLIAKTIEDADALLFKVKPEEAAAAAAAQKEEEKEEEKEKETKKNAQKDLVRVAQSSTKDLDLTMFLTTRSSKTFLHLQKSPPGPHDDELRECMRQLVTVGICISEDYGNTGVNRTPGWKRQRRA
eukprot:gene3058-27776_t